MHCMYAKEKKRKLFATKNLVLFGSIISKSHCIFKTFKEFLWRL